MIALGMINENLPMVDTLFDALIQSESHTFATLHGLLLGEARSVDVENVIALILSAWRTNDACC